MKSKSTPPNLHRKSWPLRLIWKPGSITSDEYDKRVAVCKQQEATFLEELKGHSEADEAFVLSCSYILELAKRAKELFERSQPEQKNRLLRFVFANASVEGEKLNYKLKSVFEGIVQCNKTKNWLPDSDVILTLLADSAYWRIIARRLVIIDSLRFAQKVSLSLFNPVFHNWKNL